MNATKPATSIHLEPMKVAGIHNLVERAYRESAPLQYVREVLVNALEAGATRIEFSPEWQAVERLARYRFMVADDGKGMDPEQILAFLNTFGGGGKPIGDAHENYGIGSKTSTLPWNHQGVVVLSRTERSPQGAMVWLARDPVGGEYGARRFRAADGSWDSVVEPFDDTDSGIDWRAVWPSWITTHGTVMVLLGVAGTEDTFLGKAGATGDNPLKELALFMNKRFWELPEGVSVVVKELRTADRSGWPRSLAEASGPAPTAGPDRRWNRRTVEGARYYVEHPGSAAGGSLGETGTVSLASGTEVDWYLWAGPRPVVNSYAHENGFIAALYENELYDVRSHVGTYRRFGIATKEVRERLTLVVRAPKLKVGEGVYPDGARSTLRIMGSKRAGASLPWDEWGDEFARAMPDSIRAAIVAAVADDSPSTIEDARWRERLSDRFGDRWRRPGFVCAPSGIERTTPTQPGPAGGTKKGRGHPATPRTSDGKDDPTASKPLTAGTDAGPKPARRDQVRGRLPSYRWVSAGEVGDGAGAAWSPNDAKDPNGCVLLTAEFQPLDDVFKHWHAQYAEHYWPDVEKVIKAVYGEAMAARIAHSELLIKNEAWGRERVENQLRSTSALTMALLGLVNEDTIISQRISAHLGRARPAAVATPAAASASPGS